MANIYAKIDNNSRDANTAVAWNKLEKAFKLQKLYEFADRYATEKTLTPEQLAALRGALKERLSRKQLQKSKDVAYDKVKGIVVRLDCLVQQADGTFTFRNTDSVSPLAALAPKTRRLRVDVG